MKVSILHIALFFMPLDVLAGAFVTTWILIQIELVVCFRIPPLPRWKDFGDNLASFPPLFADFLSDVSRYLFLLFIVIKYATSVLRSPVWALLVFGCWVVHLVEELEQLTVGDLLGIEDYLKCFGI